MIKIVRTTLLALLLQFLASGITSAAPEASLEWYLLRAETVFIGCITERTDKEVSFEVIELLRSRPGGVSNLRRYAMDKFVMKESPTWLVISQGDNHYGKPKQVVSLGPQMDGQSGYRGWIAFAIREDGDEPYLDQVYSLVDHKAGEPIMGRLTLSKAKVLVGRYLYNPDLQDMVPNHSQRHRRK